MKKRALFRLIALIVLLLLPLAALADSFAVVQGGRLNLRAYPSADSTSLGKYDTGSWVRVVSSANGWAKVNTMDGRSGYMAMNYLNFGADGNTGVVRYANGGYVNLRSGPSLDYSVVTRVTSGMTVTILNDSYEWNNVLAVVNGYSYTGYMHDSFIDRGTSKATVTTRNGGRVNLRSGPSNSYVSMGTLATGTQVTVLLKGSGWYRISAGGMTGYMTADYLSETSGGGQTYSQAAVVNNPRSTQVLNLRESPSQSARSIGQYRNGTQVKVVEYGKTWCEVYVGTRHGYMMTQYLSFNVGTAQTTPQVVYTTPQVVYATPTPTPQVIYVTPTPTPQVIYITPTPTSSTAFSVGDKVYLYASSGTVMVFNNPEKTSLKASYASGKQATMLQYMSGTSMILIDGGVAYVDNTYLVAAD